MEKENLEKLVDSVINAASALGRHPYRVVNYIADMVEDRAERNKLVDDIHAELLKRAHTLPWSF